MPEKLLKSAEKYFYSIFGSFCAKLSQKKLSLIRSEILGLLVNTFTVNFEYSRSNRENLRLPIQVKLSENYRLFAALFLHFWHVHEICNFLEKKKKKRMTVIGQVVLKLLTPKYVLNWMHDKASFLKPFGSERVNYSQKLLKSAEKYFYTTFSSFWAKLS